MSRKGFLFGLLTGMVTMGLLFGIAGFVIFLPRWPQARTVPFHGRSFGFGLPQRPFGHGLALRPLGAGALLCGAALLLLGGLVLLALVFRHRHEPRPDTSTSTGHQERPASVGTGETVDAPETASRGPEAES